MSRIRPEMPPLDRGHARLLLWLGATVALCFTLYWNQLYILAAGLDQLLTATLGTVFPAYPFLALLVLLTALRWRDFHAVLNEERGITSRPLTRMAGALLIILPLALWNFFFGPGGSPTYLELEVSATSLVLMAFGTLLATSPSMWRIMVPYASLYAVGLVSPLVTLDTLGAPLASASSYVSGQMTNALGIPVNWQGVSFSFVSAVGSPISAVVTPACSAAYSISIYLALLGLMYLDIGSSLTTTAKFAIAGVFIIPFIDSARIVINIWFGLVGGPTVFWEVHDWLGYVMFLAFYVGVLAIYSRTGTRVGLSDKSTALDLPSNPL